MEHNGIKLIAVNQFISLINNNNNDNLTSTKITSGINELILIPLLNSLPYLKNDTDIQLLTPENIKAYDLNDNNFTNTEVMLLLDGYFDFLASVANKYGTSKTLFKSWIEDEFNRLFTPIGMDIDDNIRMDIDEINLQPPPLKKTLREIHQQLLVFDPVEREYISVVEFCGTYETAKPFIVKSKNSFTGNTIDWITNEFIECKDDAPSEWQGKQMYQRLYIKNEGKQFIKVLVGGAIVLVIKPQWFTDKTIPQGTNIFNLVEQGNVNKFMSFALFETTETEFDARGVEHCNQTTPQIYYKLEEMTLEELNEVDLNQVVEGGKKKKKKYYSKKANKKQKKYKKTKKNYKKKKN
jgi:hypothetical protein